MAKNAADKSKPAIVPPDLFESTPLKSLFVEDMDDEQIWAQLDLRTKAICRMLDFVLEGGSEEQGEMELEDEDEESSDAEADEEEQKFREALQGLETGDVDLEELMTKYGLNPEDFEDSDQSMDDDEAEFGQETDGSSSEEEEEDISPLRDSESIVDTPPSSSVPQSRPITTRGKKKGSSELDDGFFDLAEFNAETERAESKSSSRGRLAGDDDSDEEGMDIDLFATVDGVGEDTEDEGEDTGMFKHFQICVHRLISRQNCSIAISLSPRRAQMCKTSLPHPISQAKNLKYTSMTRCASKKSERLGRIGLYVTMMTMTKGTRMKTEISLLLMKGSERRMESKREVSGTSAGLTKRNQKSQKKV